MANPQLENGYLRIANELWSHICRTRIKGEARQMFDFIIRKTYGFQKKEDSISTKQFIENTGLTRNAVHKSRKWLKDMNMITVSQKGNSYFLTYSINKRYREWKVYPKKVTVPQKDTKCIPKRSRGVPQKDTPIYTKDNIQKTTKDNIIEQAKRLFGSFDNNFQNKIEVYMNRVCNKNKSGVITEGRKVTLLNELFTTKDRCNNDEIFGYAMDQAISRDACNIGYINAIIKNKRTKKPAEGRAYHDYV